MKFISYPLTVLYFICFGLVLVLFHPIQWFCLNVMGYEAHKKSVALLNLFIMKCTHILGTTYTFKNFPHLPTDRPLVIVTNHQSMYDIPPIIWHLRNHHPKFVSKKELGKGIPSVSYNLRHGGSVLIDRKDARQALNEVAKLGRYIEEHRRSAVIFPEGTRSRDGRPKPFKTKGLEAILKNAPSALVVPISINNSWKMVRYGKFPMGLGSHITFDVHQPLANQGALDVLIKKVETTVTSAIKY